MKNTELDNMSMFDDCDGEGGSKIHVSKLTHECEESVLWEDLFTGYDRLYAITYSSGIAFACELIKKFRYAEIIFGNQTVMSYSLQEIIAFQSITNAELKKAASKSQIDIAKRIREDTLHLWVARAQLSHEKVYLLEADDGRKRVIMGSANMSRIAFTGKQRENIIYVDGDSMFDAYKSRFDEMKDFSADTITENALVTAKDGGDENEIDRSAIKETIKREKIVVLEPQDTTEEEVRFSVDVKQLADKLAPYVPVTTGKEGQTIVGVEQINKMKSVYKSAETKKKEIIFEPYKMTLNMEEKTAELNGKPLSLTPGRDEVKADVELFIQYMKGFEAFSGDWETTQRSYYTFANWYFCSVFMMRLRIAAITSGKTTLAYPAFGCICGKSNAGKTTFLTALEKMTLGATPVLNGVSYTTTNIDRLRRTIQGPAIVIDDVSEDRFKNHGEKVIKQEDFGVSDNLESAACLCFSANTNIKVFSPEITKRMVIAHSDINMSNEEAYRNSGIIASLKSKMGTALYREYLYRMIPVVNDIITELKCGNLEDVPEDVLVKSSKVLHEIFEEYTDGQVPDYITDNKDFEKYFGTKEVSRRAIEEVKLAWISNKRDFAIDRKRNRVTYNAKEVYIARKLSKGLPPDLNVETASSYVSFALKESEKYFDKMFTGGIFSKFLAKKS